MDIDEVTERSRERGGKIERKEIPKRCRVCCAVR
nr:MAG TPA: Apo-citrate lyase phosphoribosyl-dephospho-CoA transferase [Caudoviricetes sp.]DAY68130.1 MAG TPA: Apo-citrate lyase phosphoribosyl-dephospho-CoA transferase [Caudoviricetes sp.]